MQKKTRGVIAAGHQKTVEAGIEMFRNGGNAFDATVAAMLASFVAESALTSAGGSGFLLAHTRDGNDILFDFFSQTPRQKKKQNEIDFYPVEVNFGDASQEFHIGRGAIAVPGNIAGIFHVHKKLGRLPFKVVAEPAIHYARIGIEVNQFQAYLFGILKPILLASKAGCEIYAPRGELLQLGETILMKDFAAMLEYLVEAGAIAFYRGDIAQQLVKDCQDGGGYLTLEDLKNYQVIERRPLSINYRGHSLLTNPPPSAGGPLIAFTLNLLATVDLAEVGFGTEQHLQLLIEAMRLTNEARQDGFKRDLDKQQIAETFLASDRLSPYKKQFTQQINKLGSTTHISVMDGDGNAASVTSSNGEGSGYAIPGTGIMANNMLGEEDLNPYGFHQWLENARISSMMSPTVVLQDNRPKLVLGSGGSNRIRTAIVQVISNSIDFQMPVNVAVDSPRIHWENGTLHLEPRLGDSQRQTINFSDNKLVLWQQKNMYFGGAHAVLVNLRGKFEGAGDRRRNGDSAIC